MTSDLAKERYCKSVSIYLFSHFKITMLAYPAGKVEGELRLVSNIGSTGGSSGRLEINHNLVWGTVCFYDNSFSSKSALVACRQLGYVTVSQYGSVTSMG